MIFIKKVPEKKESFIPEYLYIEEYPLQPLQNTKEETDEDNRGVIVIELF